MKLLDLDVKNFLGLPDGKYSFTHPTAGAPSRLTLIGGRAASGKTSLLEAIIALKESVGSYHVPPDPSRFLRWGASTGHVRGTWLLTPDEMTRAELDNPLYSAVLPLAGGEAHAPQPACEQVFGGYSRDSTAGKIEYFPCNRQLESRPLLPFPDEGARPHLRLSRRPDKYAGIELDLLRLAMEDGLSAITRVNSDGILLKGDQRDSLAVYRAAIAALCPRLRLRGVELCGKSAAIWFERDDEAVVELHALSHSEQQGVLFAIAHELYGLSESILLIDEPELHIHPEDRIHFLRALVELGRDSQIIAATSSNELLETTPQNSVILLPGRSA